VKEAVVKTDLVRPVTYSWLGVSMGLDRWWWQPEWSKRFDHKSNEKVLSIGYPTAPFATPLPHWAPTVPWLQWFTAEVVAQSICAFRSYRETLLAMAVAVAHWQQ